MLLEFSAWKSAFDDGSDDTASEQYGKRSMLLIRNLIGTSGRFLTLVTAAIFLVGCERYKLDQQMAVLCKKDGGVKVHEKVTLVPAEYNEIFRHVAKEKSYEDRYGPNYRYVHKWEDLVGAKADPEKGEGRLSRFYAAIYRRSDSYLLGELVSYGRTGGDFFTFGFHPSSNHCPKPRIDLAQSIFVKGN